MTYEQEKESERQQFKEVSKLWRDCIVICLFGLYAVVVHNNHIHESTVRACLAKSVSPNLAGCMVH